MIDYNIYREDDYIYIELEDFSLIRISGDVDFGLNIDYTVEINRNEKAIGNIPESKWVTYDIK